MNVRALFGLSVLCSFVAWGIVVWLFAWPTLGSIAAKTALLALIAPHMFRFVGLSFLVPGVVSETLPQRFARQAGWGDFIAGLLAIAATLAVVASAPWAVALIWIFNLWGTADLLNALVQGPIQLAKASPGALGAAYFIPTFLVPGLLASHALIFRLLTAG
jgi:hypothetical protein